MRLAYYFSALPPPHIQTHTCTYKWYLLILSHLVCKGQEYYEVLEEIRISTSELVTLSLLAFTDIIDSVFFVFECYIKEEVEEK